MGIMGYKVFNPDWTCKGFQYEVGKTYKHEENIKMCGRGFHFCQKAASCFDYYKFDPKNKVAEVEAIGLVETQDNKSVTDEIIIIREISWQELLTIVNTGDGCTGLSNSGNNNSGNHNSGNWNSGNFNSGDWNSGDFNSGNCNSSNYNSGHRNSGNHNSGDCNSSDYNSGYRNSGNRNSGNRNSGNGNSGYLNSGNGNSGDFNSGNCNSGNCNSGNYNSGNFNSGDWNSGYLNSITPKITAFNKPTDLTHEEFHAIKGVCVLDQNYEDTWWVSSANMTDKEKKDHPEHENVGGYLKTIDFKTACKLMWERLNEDEKQAVKEIPNFDAEVFKEITGIDVEGTNNE